MEWIKIKTRPATEEEQKEFTCAGEFDEVGFVYDCQLPDDGQEVLITTCFGTVEKVTFYRDSYYGCYFEQYEDAGDVLAWMPLPLPYKAENEIYCNYTDTEIAKSFIEDVEACQSYLREE